MNNAITGCWEENRMLASEWLPGRVTLDAGLAHVASIAQTLASCTAQTEQFWDKTITSLTGNILTGCCDLRNPSQYYTMSDGNEKPETETLKLCV